MRALVSLAVLGLIISGAAAGTVLGPWTPLFKGIDHAVGTNTPGGGGFATLQVVHAVRVDLTDPDITFGTALVATEPYRLRPQMNIAVAGGTATITWSESGFTLQQADAPTGPWAEVPGPVVSSPFNLTASGSARFFRLAKLSGR